MNLGLLGTALAMGIAAIGSAIGIGIAGQASIGAWKKCYMNNKAAPFILTVFAGAPLTQTIYGFLLMQRRRSSLPLRITIRKSVSLSTLTMIPITITTTITRVAKKIN